MTENEPKPEENLESRIARMRSEGYKIEPIAEEDLRTCQKDDCFTDAKWFVEGNDYCLGHTETTLKLIEEADQERKREKATREAEHELYMEEQKKLGGWH